MRESDRIFSRDEKEQKRLIKNCCKEIANEHPELDLDLSDYDGISSGVGKCGKYFSHNGKLLPVSEKRDHCDDSKALDGVAYFRNLENGRCLEVYFFCKFTVRKGGVQDGIPFEVKVTRENIERNDDEKVVVAFMLEGNYWTPRIIDECKFDTKKTFYVNRDNIKEILTNILTTNKIL